MCNIGQKIIIQNQDIRLRSLLDPIGRDNLNLAPKNPNQVLESEEVFYVSGNPEKSREYDLKQLELEAKMYERGIKFPEKVEHINIEYLINSDISRNPYPPLEGEELLEMHNSLEKYGQIFPVLVIKSAENRYTLLDGNSRVGLMRFMYVESNKERFKTIKCFVFDIDSLNEIEIVDIILTCNISRKCSIETMTRVYMMRIEVEKARKTRKNEINVYRKVAKDTGVSVSTLHNYRTLSNCSEKTMFLLDNGYIHSASARKLAKLTKEMQDKIIDEFGLYNVRDEYLKWINVDISERSIKAMVKEIKSWKYPLLTVLKITGARNDIITLKEDIEKILETKKVSMKPKIRLLKTKFGFKCGYQSLETAGRNEPPCYKELLKQENHPQMDIIKKVKRRQ